MDTSLIIEKKGVGKQRQDAEQLRRCTVGCSFIMAGIVVGDGFEVEG
jgi:hypothetical protein